MPISTITAVAFKNSFSSQYGDANGQLHSFNYTFADGTTGQANHKQATPPFPVGSSVEYTITKTTEYGNSLKVKKPTDNPQARQPQSTTVAGVPATTVPGVPVPHNGTYFGATVGMAVNNGCQIAMKSCEAGAFDPGSPAFWDAVYHHASRILRLSSLLESGQLAAKPGQRQQPPPPAAEPPTVARPQPGPEGSAFPAGADEDVPF